MKAPVYTESTVRFKVLFTVAQAKPQGDSFKEYIVTQVVNGLKYEIEENQDKPEKKKEERREKKPRFKNSLRSMMGIN